MVINLPVKVYLRDEVDYRPLMELKSSWKRFNTIESKGSSIAQCFMTGRLAFYGAEELLPSNATTRLISSVAPVEHWETSYEKSSLS